MRLPTVDELKQMYEKECSGNKYEAKRCNKWYWSSEDYAPNTAFAMFVGLDSGYVGGNGKTSVSYVRCVRAGP